MPLLNLVWVTGFPVMFGRYQDVPEQGQGRIVSTMGGAMVNDAKVVGADVAADNGVIHAIDTVLIPK